VALHRVSFGSTVPMSVVEMLATHPDKLQARISTTLVHGEKRRNFSRSLTMGVKAFMSRLPGSGRDVQEPSSRSAPGGPTSQALAFQYVPSPCACSVAELRGTPCVDVLSLLLICCCVCVSSASNTHQSVSPRSCAKSCSGCDAGASARPDTPKRRSWRLGHASSSCTTLVLLTRLSGRSKRIACGHYRRCRAINLVQIPTMADLCLAKAC